VNIDIIISSPLCIVQAGKFVHTKRTPVVTQSKDWCKCYLFWGILYWMSTPSIV